MSNYRRAKVPGGTYFITQVTYHRQTWLTSDIARQALRTAIIHVRQNYPFTIEAFVLLPDHFHCLLMYFSMIGGIKNTPPQAWRCFHQLTERETD